MEVNVLPELDVQLNAMVKVFEKTPWRDRDMYGAWLAQTFYYVRHGTRMITLAASRFALTEDPLHRRFIKHAAEETGHDVLALRDLQNLGRSVDQFPEFPSTSALYQTNYYLIEHVSPWALWGLLLTMEGLAVKIGPWLFNEIKQHHGEKPGSFVKLHAFEDIAHMAEAEKIMQNLPDSQRPLVVEQINHTRFHYCSMLEQCTKYAQQPAVGAA
jgi:hypothetical protein